MNGEMRYVLNVGVATSTNLPVSMHAGVIVFNVSFYTAAFAASRNDRGRPCIVFLEVYIRTN